MSAPGDAGAGARLAYLNVKFGLCALLAYLTLGLALEGLHGFKVAWYLDFEIRRTLWTLAHAHGVLLGILTIGFGMLLHVRPDPALWTRTASACLMGATVLLPGGFFLGGTWVHGGDPGAGVLLSPIGGVLLLAGVALTALHYRPR